MNTQDKNLRYSVSCQSSENGEAINSYKTIAEARKMGFYT